MAAPYCSVLSLVRLSCPKVADRIPGKWPQAHSPAIGGGVHKDEQWISTKTEGQHMALVLIHTLYPSETHSGLIRPKA